MFSHRLHQTHLRLQHTQPLRPSPRTRTDPHFGFIYCADRPIELFFQLVRVRSNDIHLHDEVEFYVGPSSSRGNRTDADGDKLSAYAVRLLEPGTIQWEVEDEPIGVRNRGRVERVSRVYTRDREWNPNPTNITGSSEGTIRVLLDNDQRGPLVRYNATNSNNDGSHSRLNGNGFARNDIVEFTMVTEKRSQFKYARNITMI